MKPFAYQAPATISEAVALLAAGGRHALPFAGGTDLLVSLRRGLTEADLLVDVKKIPELGSLSLDPAAGLTIGAALPCARLCEQPDVQQDYPALIDAACVIGGAAVQERATLGGNLCNAAPSADSIPALIVLAATCTISGPAGARTVAVETFCTGPGETILQPGELLVSIHLPPPVPRSGAGYVRFTPRREMDIAVAGAGAWVTLDTDGRIADARIALSAVAPTPLAVAAAGAALVGREPGEEAFAEAARIARKAARPISDVRGTAAQRRHLVEVLVKRALRAAANRAQAREG